jgi:predicted nucleic acid-binding protein
VRFLVDTSASIRIWRKQVDPGWYDIIGRGLIVMCERVLAETLMAADAKVRRNRREEELRGTYIWAMVPDNIWDLVAAIRRELAPHSAHQGLSVVTS